MTTENTPLLQNGHDLIYERFSPRKKGFLVTIASCGGLLAFFTSETFVPSIPQIARDLGSTGEVINLTVSIFIFATSIGGLVGSKYAKFYGRRPIYLWSFLVTMVASIGVATARTVPQLIVWRFFQGVGSSPGLSVGVGVIGDIYKLEERGTALGTFFGTGLLGFALAPIVGGVTAQYISWRGIHYGLAAAAASGFFCILWLFPETSHPGTMGIDEYKNSGKTHPKWRPVLLNPLTQLLYLRSPNVLAVTLVESFVLLTDLSLILPFAYTIGKRYGIKTEAMIGLCFLPLGVGNTLGAPLSGWISDKIVIKYKKKRGYWYPEDRLRACLFGAFIPASVFIPSLITKYVTGRLGLALSLICLFINGVGVDIAMTPCGAYIIDILHSNSAEATAAVNALQSTNLALSTAVLLPMINSYGHIFTSSIVAVLVMASFGLAYLTILYGESMRNWIDVGYSTADNN